MSIITRLLTAVIPKQKSATLASKAQTSINLPEAISDSFESTCMPTIHTNARLAKMLPKLPAQYSRKQEYQAVIGKFFKGEMKREELYLYLLKNAYRNLRVHQYALTNNGIGFEMLTGRETADIGVINKYGWHYRIPLNKTSPEDYNYRISMNVNPDKKLISFLDKLISSKEINGYYKTPDDCFKWFNRHDPVVIYMEEKPSEKILQKIAALFAPFVRSSENVIPGEKIIPGIVEQSLTNYQDGLNLINIAEKVDTELKNALIKFFGFGETTKNTPPSNGCFYVAKNLIQDLKALENYQIQ